VNENNGNFFGKKFFQLSSIYSVGFFKKLSCIINKAKRTNLKTIEGASKTMAKSKYLM